MSFAVVIPARYGSSRLPGKPLLDIAGKPMIQRVWEQAHYQHTEGRLEQESWEAMNAQFMDFMALEAISSVWKIRKKAFRRSFREYVESLSMGDYQYK
mgnify:CR=1 FL=1